jgi:light-regulated signal transduction histidine kinase (bacteriophytochrome)
LFFSYHRYLWLVVQATGRTMKHDQVIHTSAPAACDIEQIQFLGQIQPFGFLLEVSPDWIVVRASANVGKFIAATPEAALGMRLDDLLGRRAVHDVRGEIQVIGRGNGTRKIYGVAIEVEGTPHHRLDLSIMRQGDSLIIEGEPQSVGDAEVAVRMQSLLSQLRGVADIRTACELMAGHVRALTGFDRVMMYQFHDDYSGEVIAERRSAFMDSFIGLRFPASDIPAQARLLYLRNPLRIIADVAAVNVAVLPQRNHAGAMLDLSMISLRAVSPVHIEYLRNMRVAASLSISVIVDGRLWGLLACHHSGVRELSLKVRTALEFYGQMASSIIETIVRTQEKLASKRTREIHTSLLSLISVDADGEDNTFEVLSQVRTDLRATGFATWMDGRLRTEGSTPGPLAITALLTFFNGIAVSEVYATNCMASVCPAAVEPGSPVAGVMAIPISRIPRDYVMYFRDELVREVKWAGQPGKRISSDGLSYSPRQSFNTWKELVRGQSNHWTSMDFERGEALRITLLEVMLRLTDSAEKTRKQSNDQQDTLIAELNHRVRNILNLILGLVRQCGDNATSIASLTEDVNSRIHALARAHDQLTSSGWRARSLFNMVRVEAGAYLGTKAERVLIHGIDWAIEPDAFATMALVFHEIITNSAKYGAFKDSHGHAELVVQRRSTGELHLRWSEHGGAVVSVPQRRGFGSTIIERAIPHELSGKAEIEFAPEGLVATFEIPACYVSPCEAQSELVPEPMAVAGNSGVQAYECNILLVEDNLLIALETEANLLAMGARTVQVASTVGAAIDALRQFRPDFAVLDYNLGRENSIPVAERLRGMGIPFLFATGYGDTNVVDERFRGYPIIAKPYDATRLLQHFTITLSQRGK